MPSKHLYDVEDAQEDFLAMMAIFGIFDMALICMMIHRLKKFQRQLKNAKGDINRKGNRKCKNKKRGRKCRRIIEEIKEPAEQQPDIEAHHDFQPTIQEESVNTSAQLDESQDELIKKTEVVPETQPVPQQVPQMMISQTAPVAYPQTIQIGGRTYMAVKVSDMQNLQRVPAHSLYMRNGSSQF